MRQEHGDPSITGIVHTRNEAHNVTDALRSLGWVDRLLVVDMESEDETVAIAREHGADVLEVANVGYVEPARNQAIDATDSEWVLILDADERITETLAGQLAEIARGNHYDIVKLHCHTWMAGQFLQDSGWLGQYHPRFFRRGAVIYSGRVHQPPTIEGRVHQIEYTPESSIIHFNYDDLAHFLTKLNRYTDKEADALEGEPVTAWPQLARDLRQEFSSRWMPGLDGPLSAALAFNMLFYRFTAQAKHWERTGFPDVQLPEDPAAALRALAHDGDKLHTEALEAADRGDGRGARDLLRRSVTAQLNVVALNDYAVTCAATGDNDTAIAVLRTCVALDPAYAAAADNLAALEQAAAGTQAPVLYHVGCGDIHLDGYVNVDVRPTAAADIVADLNEMQLPYPALGFYSNAFFEHIKRDARAPHLTVARAMLGDNGFVCYTGLPDFRSVAEAYLNRAPGILSETFDLYHVYRYTHGDPEGVDHYMEQLHKSLFDSDELDRLITEAGFPAHTTFNYVYPGEQARVTMGFYAATAPMTKGELRVQALEFLQEFDGRFLVCDSVRFLS